MAYIPALLYTLYDGYYIYTPVKQENGDYTHEIRPYVYYTKTYTNTNGSKTLTINFSLDNYIVVYYYSRDDCYQSRAGYLENPSDTNAEGTKYKGYDITDPDAQKYYKEAYEFTNWFNTVLKNDFASTEAYRNFYISSSNSPLQDATSAFNDEKVKVIEDSITNNLKQAMDSYSKYSGKNFRAPILTGVDWDKILNNICVVSFMQDIPVGTSLFNDYAIITSTDNSMYVDDNTLYFTGSDNPNIYHRIGCKELKGTITGHNKSEFKLKQLEEDGTITYVYQNSAKACYYCVVRASDAGLPSNASNNVKTAYYNALAKEKYKLVKISDYVNRSGRITK